MAVAECERGCGEHLEGLIMDRTAFFQKGSVWSMEMRGELRESFSLFAGCLSPIKSIFEEQRPKFHCRKVYTTIRAVNTQLSGNTLSFASTFNSSYTTHDKAIEKASYICDAIR